MGQDVEVGPAPPSPRIYTHHSAKFERLNFPRSSTPQTERGQQPGCISLKVLPARIGRPELSERMKILFFIQTVGAPVFILLAGSLALQNGRLERVL